MGRQREEGAKKLMNVVHKLKRLAEEAPEWDERLRAAGRHEPADSAQRADLQTAASLVERIAKKLASGRMT